MIDKRMTLRPSNDYFRDLLACAIASALSPNTEEILRSEHAEGSLKIEAERGFPGLAKYSHWPVSGRKVSIFAALFREVESARLSQDRESLIIGGHSFALGKLLMEFSASPRIAGELLSAVRGLGFSIVSTLAARHELVNNFLPENAQLMSTRESGICLVLFRYCPEGELQEFVDRYCSGISLSVTRQEWVHTDGTWLWRLRAHDESVDLSSLAGKEGVSEARATGATVRAASPEEALSFIARQKQP